MPIFEFDGKKYDVEDRYMNDFSKAFPDATSVFERDNKRYRVKASDYGSFMKYYQDPINDSVSREEGTEGSDSYLKDLGESFMQGVGSLGKIALSPVKKAADYVNESDIGKAINERLGLEGGQFGQWYESADKMEKEYAKRSDRYGGKDFIQLLKDGRYADALGEVFLSATKSAPTSLGIMAASAAGSPAAGLALMGAGTASEKYDQLGEENPDMGSGAKMVNSLFTGLFEAGTEYLGAGAAGTAIRQLLKSAGREAAGDAIKKSLMQKSADFMKKHYIVGPIAEEAMEETVNALGEYITDKLTGVERDDNILETMLKSGVYGAAGGAQYSPIIAGARFAGDKMSKSDQGVDTPPQLTKSRFAEAEEEGRNMTDPGDIRTASKKIEETRLSLSEMVPGLASTIESYVDDKASEAQVMSLLDGVNADARPLAEDFYADYLRISGLQDRIGEEIDNEVETYVANNITPYVTTNPDGQSIVTTATLSEGNVERPVYVRSIEGDKAVISDNGQDRMVSAKRLSDIVEQDAGHMRRTYEDQLLATRQSELDMTMHHNPKTQLPKPGLIVWNGDNAFILQGQDENGDWIAQPSAYDRETGQVTAKNGSSPAMPITENEILDLQDAIYDAQQVNVVSPEDDNVASADAEITSAPPVEDAINQPTSEIETEGAIDQIAQPSNVENPSMVMREDGTPDFVSSGTDMALDFLYDKYGDKMPRKIEVTRKSFDESLKKASDALEKAQEEYDDAPIGKEDKAEAALIKARKEYEAIKVEADFWANLDDDIKEASKKPGDVIAKEISVMGDPMSGEELAAMMLANGAIKLTRDSYKKETGAGNNETARMFGLFASPEKGGVNIERAGEILELADRENGTNFFDENDTNAGRDAIIEVLSSAHTRGDLIDYVKRNREAIAERERQAEYNAYAEWCEENYHMSPEEYEAYEESMVRDFSEKQLTDEERGELDSQIADEIQAIIDEQNEIDAILAQNKPIENENIEGNDESGGDGLREGGGEVLPREQLDQTGGTGEVEGRESVGPDIDRTDGAAQEGAPEEVDRQGNPIDSEGNLIIEDVSSVSDITDEDFINPKRSIGLPPIPQNVSEAIASDGKKVIIKRNIFEKNVKKHAFDPQSSRDILEAALYNTDIVGQSQPLTRKNHWVAIKLDDKSPIVVLEVNHNKDNVEIVGWYTLDNRNLDRIKRQAEREGGELLILTPKGAAASLSTLPDNSSSTDKGSISSSENQANEVKSFVAPSPKESENPLDYAERIVEAKRLHDEELKVDTTPSEAQKEAGNYKKGHIKINGFDVTIEQPAGSVRSGKDANGKEWSVTMNNTYGYIRGTESVDGDHIDVFLGPDMNSDMVYVVDQVNTDGSFDEHKVMMGFSSLEDARSAYLSNYEEGWKGLGNITGVALDGFKKWIDSSTRKTKPFSEYKSVVPVSPLTVSRSDKSNEYPLLDIAVDPIVWMKNNPGKTPTSKDLFPAGKADEYLGTIIDEQVVTTDKGITLKYTKYKNGYSITAEKDGGYIKQSYYNNGLPMTSPKFNIGVNDSSFKQYIKKSKDGTLYIDNKDIIPLFVEDVSRKVKKLSLVDKDDYITSAERKHIKAFLESGLKEARVNNSIYEISNIGDDGVYEIVRRFNYTDPLTLVKDENGKLVNKRGEGEHVIRVKPTFEETRPDSGIRFRETRIIPEEENIIKKAKSDGSYMKAPNGNPTNLNEKQWVQVRTKAFKEWFGDWENNPEDASKVIDENGEPRVVYHGTYADFNAFDESHLGDVTNLNATNEDWAKTSHIGFWFNDNKIGFYTKHKPVFLNVRNPLEFASMESLVDEMSYYDSGEDFKRSNSDGYDSVIVLEDEEMGGRSYVVFNDNQIKSVTENNEDFSFHNDETSKNEAVKQASEIDGAHFRFIGDKGAANLNKAETIESSINDWSNKLNTPVRVIHDVDDITDTDENMLARKRDSKGWYDTSTGEIVIVSPNSTSVGDAQRTFLHEVVGHHGLRELFGDDFDTFLDNVYRNANDDIRKNIIDRTKGNPLNLREATEEYIAELAERGFDNKADRSLWEKIKDSFLDMLRKAGISLDFKLSDNDLRYILWRSYKNLEQGNLMDVAEDIVMRNRLSLNNINLNENGSIARDIEPEKGKQPSETKGTGRELETIDGVDENGNESERDHIDKPRGVENAIDGTENATDRNGKETDGQVDNYGDQFDGGDTGDRNGSVRDGIGGDRTVIGRAGSENKGRGVGESVREKTDDFSFAEKTIRFRENAQNESVLFADNDIQVVEKQVGSAKDQYERTLSTSSYQFQEAFQDSMLGLKTLQDAVAKATRSRILDYENAYMAENALSSVNEAEFNAYRKAAFEPILKAMSRLEKMGSTIDEIRDYLITKHGIERNREMAVKRALSQNSETYKSLLDEYIGRRNEIRENGRSWEEQQSEMDRLAEEYGANLSDDFSGFTSMYPNEDNTGYDPDSARRYVLDYESRYDTSELSASVKRATDAILAKQRDSGLMSQNTFESISDMYQFYVPLRGWEETTADEVYAYLTSESQTFNAPIKTVVGRKSKADDPIATIANMAESGIMQGNRNLMKQKFLTMVQNHKTDLVSVSEMWVRLDEASGEWIAVFPDIPSNANPEQVESIVESFNKRMEELSNEKGSNVRRSRDAIGIPYKILPKDLKEHQVIVKRAGKEYLLTINGNPRAAQALNGLTNPDNTKGWFGTVERYAGWLNRNLAANFTTRNPNFMVSNFLRDALYSNTTVWVKESPVYAWKFNKNFAMVNPINMYRLVKGYENGTLDMSDPLNKAYHDFVMRGGETGYTNLRDVEAKKKAIQKELQYSKQKVSIGKALKILGEWMDLFNKSVENCARFAAFLTSREMGRSMDKSIYDAKEISVNFNKKGAGSKFLNTEGQTKIGNASAFTSGLSRSMYVFWNAGVQGMYNFGRLAKDNPKKFLGLASSFYLLGTIMPMIAAAFGDDEDDDYYDLPEYVRRNNICFRNGGGNWITIPMPIELRAIYGLGEMSSGIVSGKEKYTDKKMAMKIAEQMSQVLPLDMMEGGGGFSAFVPSSVKPLIEAGDNKDWTGLPLYKDNDFNKGMPEWTKAFKSVDPAILAMTKYANELTGGNKYSKGDVNLNPAIIEHILDGYFGGIEATRSQMVKSAETAWGSRDFDWRNIPVGNRLIKSGDERTKKKAIDNAYYENLEEMDKIALRLRGYEKELDDPKNDDFEIAKYQKLLNDLEDSEEYERYEVFMDLNSELKSMMDDFKESGDEELEQEMYDLKSMMNEIARGE